MIRYDPYPPEETTFEPIFVWDPNEMNGSTTSTETRPKIPRDISISTRLGFVSFLNDCSSEVIARAMPLFLLSLGATPTFIGMIEGLAETIAIGLKSVSGWLSDQMVSRKPLVVCGYGLSVLSRIGLLWAHVPAVLGLTRLLDRTGKGLRTAPRDAMIADAAKAGRSGRDFGITRFLDTLGAVTGIATVLILGLGSNPMSDESFHIFVWIAIPFALASLVALWFLVPTIPRLTVAKKYLAWHIPKPIRGYLVVVFIFALGNSSDAFLVLRASEIGFSFRETLLLLLAFNVLAATLSVPIGHMSDRFGRVWFLVTGWMVYAVCYISIGHFADKEIFAVSLMSYGAFYGFTDGVEKALLADLLPASERGTGYGSLQTALGLAALPASLLMGIVMTHYGSMAAFTAAGSLAALGSLLLGLWALRQRRRSP